MARLEKLTSTANSDGTGTVRNEIQYDFNDFDQIATHYQSHNGQVNTSTSPKMQNTYDATAVSNVFSRWSYHFLFLLLLGWILMALSPGKTTMATPHPSLAVVSMSSRSTRSRSAIRIQPSSSRKRKW